MGRSAMSSIKSRVYTIIDIISLATYFKRRVIAQVWLVHGTSVTTDEKTRGTELLIAANIA